MRALVWLGVIGRYPSPRVDHRFKDGDTIRVGPTALTAHVTGGHTRGCTSWSFPVRDGDRVLNVVSACDLGVLVTSRYPEQGADRERSIRVLRGLPADIWVTCHARWWGRYRKFVASTTAKNPVDPFIDPEGYRAFIDAAEAELREGRVHEQHGAALWREHPWLASSLYDAPMRRTQASGRWMRFALALALALGLAAMTGAAQRSAILTNGRNLQIPINHGLPENTLDFTFCRLRYQNIRRARKSGWGDDYPQADFNFMVRLSELTTSRISRWNNGDPGFANVTPMDPDLFQCPYLRMQNAANYDFTPEETVRMRDYLLKGGFLWIDDNWDPDFDYIRANLMRILPDARVVDLPVDHPIFSTLYQVDTLPQIPSMGSWLRGRQDGEFGPSTVHYYGVFDDHERLVVLVSMNSDVSDSWEREGDNPEYFHTYGGKGYALGVNVAVYAMTH